MIATCAPSRARPMAVALPIPLVAPVIRTVLPDIRPLSVRNSEGAPASLAWPAERAGVGRSWSRSWSAPDGDDDLAADLAGLEQPHRVGRVVERVAAVHARENLAGLDEVAKVLVVAG